jgi:hypothetical protein
MGNAKRSTAASVRAASRRKDIEQLNQSVYLLDEAMGKYILERFGADTLGCAHWRRHARRKWGREFGGQIVDLVDRYIKQVRTPGEAIMADLAQLSATRPRPKVIVFSDAAPRPIQLGPAQLP